LKENEKKRVAYLNRVNSFEFAEKDKLNLKK